MNYMRPLGSSNYRFLPSIDSSRFYQSRCIFIDQIRPLFHIDKFLILFLSVLLTIIYYNM